MKEIIKQLPHDQLTDLKNFVVTRLREAKHITKSYAVLIEACRRKLIIENKDAKCEKCGGLNDVTIDHIVPVSLLENFGLPVECLVDESNFQLLCRRCNNFKAHRLDFSNPKTKPLLVKFVNQIE